MDKTRETIMNQINESYAGIDFTSLHFHISEMLSGHEKDSTERFFRSVNYPLPFHFDNCRMIVTGLPQNIYKHLFDWHQSEAAQFFAFEYKKTVDQLLEKHGYSGLSIIFLFDGRKHYVTLFSPLHENWGNPWKMAEEINDFLQEKYRRMNSSSNNQVWNFTALSSPIRDYNQIAVQFERCKELVKLSWFIQRSQVIDENWVKNNQIKESRVYLINRLHDVLNQALDADQNKNSKELQSIFDLAGQMLDFTLIQDMLSLCKEMMNNLIVTYRLECTHDIENLCRISSYLYYSRCSFEVRNMILSLVRQVHESKKVYSALTKKIIYYLHSNFSKQITISDIADHVHASANYCSTLFKKETGFTINEALTKLRIEEAKRLLIQGDLKIKEIASLCGFGSARYFSEVFSKHTSLPPLAWQKKYLPSLDQIGNERR